VRKKSRWWTVAAGDAATGRKRIGGDGRQGGRGRVGLVGRIGRLKSQNVERMTEITERQNTKKQATIANLINSRDIYIHGQVNVGLPIRHDNPAATASIGTEILSTCVRVLISNVVDGIVSSAQGPRRAQMHKTKPGRPSPIQRPS
jgi:hypothetical protein